MGQEPASPAATDGGQEPAAPAAPQAPPEPKPAEDKGAESPESFTPEYVKELRAENARRRVEAQEAKDKIKEFEDRDKTETEKLSGKVESLSGENKATKAENLRLRVALDKKLPTDLIDRLKGDTKEELEADADKLLELVKPTETPTDFDGGARTPAPGNQDPEKAHNADLLRLAGRSPN